MNIFTNANVTLWLNGVEAIVFLLTFCVACRALGQIKLMREQNSLTRESITISELRKFEEFIVIFGKLNESIKKRNDSKLKLPPLEMQDFSLSESAKPEFKTKMLDWNKFYVENQDLYREASACSNKLEIIAIALEYGTAKLDIIEDTIASAFCSFVEQNAYVYIRNRNVTINLYKSTIELYKRFKPKVLRIDEQTKKIKEEMEKSFSIKMIGK